MIIKKDPSWAGLIFSIKGSDLSDIWFRLLVTTLVGAGVTVVYKALGPRAESLSLTALPFSLIAVALAIFLGFRNNASYDRWWEGRRLWGQLVNACRSLTRQTLTLVRAPAGNAAEEREAEELQRETIRRAIAFAHALRLHLREDPATNDLEPFLPAEELARLPLERNRPLAILQAIGIGLRQAYDRGWVHPYHLPVLEGSVAQLTDVQGGCERIRQTPVPFAYTVLMHRIITFYCLSLPFGIVPQVGWMTPIVVFLIAYAFFGLDSIGDEIHDPFGTDPNDLPLHAISRNIEINLRQRLGETDLPAPLQPVNEILV